MLGLLGFLGFLVLLGLLGLLGLLAVFLFIVSESLEAMTTEVRDAGVRVSHVINVVSRCQVT